MVERSPRHPEVEDSSPAATTGTVRERDKEREKEIEREREGVGGKAKTSF
jgi:hypothetical protein